jgi:hypothetical protein
MMIGGTKQTLRSSVLRAMYHLVVPTRSDLHNPYRLVSTSGAL